MAEVGKFSSKNTTNFKQTCNLLSQYIKENGSFNGLKLGMSCSLDGQDKFSSPVTTMDLLPNIERSRKCTPDLNSPSFSPYYNSIDSRKESVPENAQLTIFYGGKVLVFDRFPSDKAQELMVLAGKGGAGDVVSMSPGVSSSTGSTGRLLQRPPTPACSDLPIMRKNSLHRFLEKRKDRITAKAPYPAPPAPAAAEKPEGSKPWLGLSPQT